MDYTLRLITLIPFLGVAYIGTTPPSGVAESVNITCKYFLFPQSHHYSPKLSLTQSRPLPRMPPPGLSPPTIPSGHLLLSSTSILPLVPLTLSALPTLPEKPYLMVPLPADSPSTGITWCIRTPRGLCKRNFGQRRRARLVCGFWNGTRMVHVRIIVFQLLLKVLHQLLSVVFDRWEHVATCISFFCSC